MKSRMSRLSIALLTAGCAAAAPAAFADEVIVVRDTTDIPDGMSGVMSWKPTIGSEWGMPSSALQTSVHGILHSIATTMYAGTSSGYGSWTAADWDLVSFIFHFWESEAAWFSSPNIGQQVVYFAQPSSVSWSVGANHLGWPIHRFTFEVLDAAISVELGQNHVVAIQVWTTPLSAPGLPFHSLSPGGFGQEYDLYASLTHPPKYLWDHGTSQPYLATAARVQVPGPKCEPADLNCDSVVDVSDLLILLAAWGTCGDSCDCPADLNGNSAVDVSDLLQLLANWG